ncbi:hypothetical protein [Bradyrhizobium sp. WSM471]|uniref:hypothetical protein n=1 Tax=Bradyrhizobium sp. WSM471 TaxID=319017 RepID=UPI0012FCAF1B|nr:MULTISPECIES: hypothetical protein [Bradyrhizobium]UFW42308.1 hypothetical protein BcanWSM471_03610 [Bradyrhizobium canariense]
MTHRQRRAAQTGVGRHRIGCLRPVVGRDLALEEIVEGRDQHPTPGQGGVDHRRGEVALRLVDARPSAYYYFDASEIKIKP